MLTATFLSLLPLALAAPAPLIKPRGSQLIEGKYIVKMKDQITASVLDEAMTAFQGDADRVYNVEGFKGFASTLDEAALETLQNHPDVSISVREDHSRFPWC